MKLHCLSWKLRTGLCGITRSSLSECETMMVIGARLGNSRKAHKVVCRFRVLYAQMGRENLGEGHSAVHRVSKDSSRMRNECKKQYMQQRTGTGVVRS